MAHGEDEQIKLVFEEISFSCIFLHLSFDSVDPADKKKPMQA